MSGHDDLTGGHVAAVNLVGNAITSIGQVGFVLAHYALILSLSKEGGIGLDAWVPSWAEWLSTTLASHGRYSSSVTAQLIWFNLLGAAWLSVSYISTFSRAYFAHHKSTHFRCGGEAFWKILYQPQHNYLAFLGCNAACLGSQQFSVKSNDGRVPDVLAHLKPIVRSSNRSAEYLVIAVSVFMIMGGFIHLSPMRLEFVCMFFSFALVHAVMEAAFLSIAIRLRG